MVKILYVFMGLCVWFLYLLLLFSENLISSDCAIFKEQVHLHSRIHPFKSSVLSAHLCSVTGMQHLGTQTDAALACVKSVFYQGQVHGIKPTVLTLVMGGRKVQEGQGSLWRGGQEGVGPEGVGVSSHKSISGSERQRLEGGRSVSGGGRRLETQGSKRGRRCKTGCVWVLRGPMVWGKGAIWPHVGFQVTLRRAAATKEGLECPWVLSFEHIFTSCAMFWTIKA